MMRFAYADPPYLGCGSLYAEHHVDATDWDFIETHAELIARLCTDYEDGWALSASSVSLMRLMPFFPTDVRIAAWVKPFASFKPNVNPAYTWEPVVFRGGRKRDRTEPTVKDHIAANITLQKGLVGAKPPAFCSWVLDLLGFDPDTDTCDDLFPGTGILSEVIAGRQCKPINAPLFSALSQGNEG